MRTGPGRPCHRPLGSGIYLVRVGVRVGVRVRARARVGVRARARIIVTIG